MNRQEIISKGFYTYPQLKGYVSVKQYILLREGNKKYLALKMENERVDAVTALTLNVRQYDSNSRFLATERVDVSNIKVNTDSSFNLGEKIALREECERFEIDVVSMTFGSYKYLVRNGEVLPVFSLDEEKKFEDTAEIIYKMRNGSQKVSRRNHISPKLLMILSAAIFLLVSAFAVFQILHFAKTEVVFTLDNIEYSFETDNRVDGPIRIDRYKGILGNIVIPENIEGHPVARISANAFSGSWIGSVSIQGDTVIDANAFAKCWFLKSAELEKVSTVGDYAFYACSSLESVSMNSATTSIGVGAFEKCTSLKDVTLPNSLEEVKTRAFFGCTALEDLTIPSEVKSIGEGALYGCRRLKNLSVPFVGENIETQKTLSHFFADGENVATPTNGLLNLTVSNFDTVLPETFKDCRYLGSISFEKEVVEIGDRAFYGCTKLVNVDITDALVSLGESAFEKCSSLKSAKISANLKDIKPRTFAKCSGLVDVVIPGDLVTVGESAFEDCISLTKLNIPSTVSQIDKAAFAGCTALTDLTVPFLGITASEPAGIDVWFLETNKNLKKITVLKGKTISEGAFKDCTGLEEVHLPQVITEIGKEAFLNCSSLKEFVVPMGVSVIEEQSFKGCVSLTKITISNKVSKINARAFEGCVALQNVEMADMIHTIEPYAFSGCTALESLQLPANLSVISEGMFSDCTALESVTLPIILDRVEERAFANCCLLTEVTLPSSVSFLAKEAFVGCSSIKDLVVPDSVLGMGERVFSGCTSLESLTLPDLKNADFEVGKLSYFFDGEAEDGKANVPDSLTFVKLTNAEFISSYAFANCENIEKIELPSVLGTVDAFAFENCKSLKNLIIPNWVSRIGQNAFSGCVSLRELSVPSVNQGSDELGGVEFWFGEIPHSLATVKITNATKIPNYAFAGSSDIKEVIFDSSTNMESVTFIGEHAFSNCINLNRVTIPSTVSHIDDTAFDKCYKLYEVINNSELQVRDKIKYALSICEDGETPEKKTVNGFEFLYADKSGGVEDGWYLVGYNGAGKHWNLPSVSDLGNYHIANYVFYRNELVESVFIPENIASFGVGMFSYCTNLKEVQWNENTTVSNIPESAFEACSKLEYLNLPISTSNIGKSAFENCKSLKQVKLYANVKYIGEDAFAGCTGMLEIVNNSNTLPMNTVWGLIPNAVSIGTEATLIEERITVDDITYNFARVANTWYLYHIDLNGMQPALIKLPELQKVDGAKYRVIKDALNIDVAVFVISTNIKSIADESLTAVCSELATVYYMGSEAEWSSIAKECNATVYYYTQCIHSEGQWNYDGKGNIVTSVNEDAFDGDGYCTVCGNKR